MMKLTFTVLLVSMLSSNIVFADCGSQDNMAKPSSIYSDHGDGTVTDNETGLMWNKCSLGRSGENCATGTAQTYTWQAALAAANDDSSQNYSDWRLPNKNELFSLVDNNCFSPALNNAVFRTTNPISIAMPRVIGNSTTFFWTSSPYPYQNDSAWSIDFRTGLLIGEFMSKSSTYNVRLVRDTE